MNAVIYVLLALATFYAWLEVIFPKKPSLFWGAVAATGTVILIIGA